MRRGSDRIPFERAKRGVSGPTSIGGTGWACGPSIMDGVDCRGLVVYLCWDVLVGMEGL